MYKCSHREDFLRIIIQVSQTFAEKAFSVANMKRNRVFKENGTLGST